jgi:hypothetical protein
MKIRHLLEIDWKVVENYSYYHEANQLIDVLVNHSCSLISGCVFFNDCPSAFKHLLLRGYNLSFCSSAAFFPLIPWVTKKIKLNYLTCRNQNNIEAFMMYFISYKSCLYEFLIAKQMLVASLSRTSMP